MQNSTLRSAYQRAGHTQNTLAEALGVSQAAVSRFASYGLVPSIATLHRIAGALGTDVSALGWTLVGVRGEWHLVPDPVVEAIVSTRGGRA